MGVTVLLGLAAAVCWGAPDLWLAQATRRIGPSAVVFGSLLIGLVATAPVSFFVEPPEWTERGVLLGIGVGIASAIAYRVAFEAFREGAVAVVTPIIACEGAIAAMLAIATGERLGWVVAAFLPIAAVGVVLAAMGRGGGRAAVFPALAAAVIWGCILVASAPVAEDLGVYWAFLVIRASALVFTIPFSIRGGAWVRWTHDPWRVAAWGIGDSAAYLLFVAAADRGPVAVASVLAAQFATIAVVVGMTFGGERLLRRQLVGVGLVIAAVTAIAATGS
jgi:drug/metabolite transporter (DMT)-like permease